MPNLKKRNFVKNLKVAWAPQVNGIKRKLAEVKKENVRINWSVCNYRWTSCIIKIPMHCSCNAKKIHSKSPELEAFLAQVLLWIKFYRAMLGLCQAQILWVPCFIKRAWSWKNFASLGMVSLMSMQTYMYHAQWFMHAYQMARMHWQHGLARNIEVMELFLHSSSFWLIYINPMHKFFLSTITNYIVTIIHINWLHSDASVSLRRLHMIGHRKSNNTWCSRVWMRSILYCSDSFFNLSLKIMWPTIYEI